jgi:hypothetical protein
VIGVCPSNPGKGSSGRVAFSGAAGTWEESYDLAESLGRALATTGHGTRLEDRWLVLADSGLRLLPQIVSIQPLDKGVHTTTTVEILHPQLLPGGTFEYQHASGANVAECVGEGFDSWLRVDLPPLLDALRPTPQDCATMVMNLPAKDGRPARRRRAVLGPPMRAGGDPAARGPAAPGGGPSEHDYCPCCLLTRSFEAFKDLLEGDGTYCLRLLALRDPAGEPGADCRLNGDDHDKGAEALRRYVKTWPGRAFEMRKQYVVMHSLA